MKFQRQCIPDDFKQIHFYKTAAPQNDEESNVDTASNIYGITGSPKKNVQDEEFDKDWYLRDFLDDENIKEESDPEEEMLDLAKRLDKKSQRIQKAIKNFDKGMSKNLDLLRDVVSGKISKDQASYKATWMTKKIMGILDIDDEEDEDRMKDAAARGPNGFETQGTKGRRAKMMKKATEKL